MGYMASSARAAEQPSGSKSLHVAIESGLKKLRPSYIDLVRLLQPEFFLRSLLTGTRLAEEVLYFGISDAPSYQCPRQARYHPMCVNESMGIQAWGGMANSYFQPPDAATRVDRPTRLGMPITSVVIVYVIHKLTSLSLSPYMLPDIDSRLISNLEMNIDALTLQPNAQDVAELGTGYASEAGFPHNFISIVGKPPRGPEHATAIAGLGYFDYV
ncbi:hypothetical protein BDV39DRAFT_206442 [Aspergillus sergii]|uniref:Uncharacterized protein n=1 Tax=Aspergillus sergii TaxID=1034303 RepID=A0A5N6WYN9_9EURO|nr:hypothetical protein BDV39DRAFT_206442 [Aspergillus sergii]